MARSREWAPQAADPEERVQGGLLGRGDFRSRLSCRRSTKCAGGGPECDDVTKKP